MKRTFVQRLSKKMCRSPGKKTLVLAAAFSLRYHFDWRIALGLELQDEGAHHSSLSRFLDRILKHGKARYAFDMILDHLVQIKLVKKNGKQRVDSTHVVAKVRELSRLELL